MLGSCLIFTTILLILSTLWISCTIVYITVTPDHLSDIKLLVTEEGGVIPMDLNSMWLESIEVTFDITFCSGNVTVISGTSCSSLPKMQYNSSNQDNSSNFYALPGSQIDIHISEELIHENHDLVHVWITPDLDSHSKLVLQTEKDSKSHNLVCADHDGNLPDPLKCFPAKNGTDIVRYEITRAGYYLFLLTNSEDTRGIYKDPSYVQWYYNYVTYDLGAIWKSYPQNSTYDIPHTSTDANGIHVKVNHTQVQIPHAFADFITDSCTLLQLSCQGSGGSTPVTVTDSKYRKDLLVLMLIVYISVVVSFITLFTVLWCLAHKR